jgi:DNA-binding transcriptional ArsR family regulator
MRIRIEIEDKGLKSSHEFESQNMDGEALRDKIVGFLSASGVFESTEERAAAIATSRDYSSGRTLMDRLESFIRFEFSNTWFTTQELREKYETVADDIKLSTVSTYLSRMNRDGLLDRRGNRNNRQYSLIEKIEPEMIQHPSIQRQNTDERRRAEGRW